MLSLSAEELSHRKVRNDMSKVGVEIIKTEETEESEIRYLNINVSNSEVERNPDIVRLCADAGILEYAKPKTGHWIYSKEINTGEIRWSECSVCGNGEIGCAKRMKYCPECGVRMEDKE